MKKSNVEGLKRHTQQKNEKTITAVNKAITQLKRNRTKITPASVARKAKISVATIYNNPPLLEKIKQIKVLQQVGSHEVKNANAKPKLNAFEEKYKKLKEEFEDLKMANSRLLANLEKKTLEVIDLREKFEILKSVKSLGQK